MEQWSPWSAWTYNEDQGLMYRVRQDLNGTLDYDWNYDYSTPRESDDVNALANGMQNVELSPASSYEPQNQGYALASSHKEKSSSKSASKHKSSKDKDKAKEKSSKHSHDKSSSHHKGHASSSTSAANQGRGSSSTTAHHQGYGQSQVSYDQQQYYASAGYNTQDLTYSAGQSSGYASSSPNAQNVAYTSANAGPSDPYSSAYSTSAYETEHGDGDVTPRDEGHISSTDDDQTELLDPRYRIEHSQRFQPGEIFKICWSEPLGGGDGHKHPSVSGKHEMQDKFGSMFHVGFRRFIVIANDSGHCTCVPILTYGSKGCRKTGVKPLKHGIIYEAGHKARPLEGEPKLGFSSVQAHLYIDGERLSKESRVNYSKLVTVEHNVKVFFIGSIVPKSWPTVDDAVNQCWGEKHHHRQP